MKMDTISVAFVLPCLNEAKTIEWCVRRALEACAAIEARHGLAGEVIVADNGSTDGSRELAAAAGARVVPIAQRGYGAALAGGFAAARGQYLVMGDSDCSYDFLEALPMIEALLDGADLCMGSRFKGEIRPGAMPWKNRYIGNPVLSGLLRFLFKTRISDSHCGLRALTRDAVERLQLSSTGMEFASEMVLKSVLKGFRITEVPVTLSPDGRGRPPHLSPWRDGMRHLLYMLMLSPTWLFMLPAGLLFVVGATIMTALIANRQDEMVWIGGVAFGDHWAVMASAAMIVAVQTGIIGVLALHFSYREGYRVPTPRSRAFMRASRLSWWLLSGLALIGIGVGWTASITAGWIASDFGALSKMRSLIAATTLAVIGSQLFFSGFLMSILSGNRPDHHAVLR